MTKLQVTLGLRIKSKFHRYLQILQVHEHYWYTNNVIYNLYIGTLTRSLPLTGFEFTSYFPPVYPLAAIETHVVVITTFQNYSQ